MTRDEILQGLPDDWKGWFVHRNGSGIIIRISRQPQPDDCEEALVEDHPDIISFINPPPTAEEIRVGVFAAEPTVIDLRSRLKDATPAQIDTWLTNNVTNLTQARVVLGAIIKYLVANRNT